MKKFTDLIADVLPQIDEIFPWDVDEFIDNNPDTLIVDIREADEFNKAKIPNSLFVPRGLLEAACDWGYDDTIPELAAARDRNIILVCRSGNRSALAAYTMQLMGYKKVKSLKTGLRGWNDDEKELIDANEQSVELDVADEFFESKVRPDQMQPKT